MLDREASWWCRIEMIVAANKEVDCSKRGDGKIRCVKTRSAIAEEIKVSFNRKL
jgi:hypothetical protein